MLLHKPSLEDPESIFNFCTKSTKIKRLCHILCEKGADQQIRNRKRDTPDDVKTNLEHEKQSACLSVIVIGSIILFL